MSSEVHYHEYHFFLAAFCCYLTLWPLFLYFSPAFSFVFIFSTIQNFDNFSQSPQLHSAVLGFDCMYVYKLYVEGKVPMGFIYCACKGRYFNAVVLCTRCKPCPYLAVNFNCSILSPYLMNDIEYISQPIQQVP